MSRRGATPFAKALFAIALADGRAEQIGQELTSIAALFDQHPDLAKVLKHPAIPTRSKREIVERLAASENVSAPLRRLLALLADRDRLSLVPDVQRAFQARLMQHLGVVEAHVTTAVPLSREHEGLLMQGLERATGKRVQLTASVDPRIMGGFVARLGSKVFDGSIVRQLELMRERLAEEH